MLNLIETFTVIGPRQYDTHGTTLASDLVVGADVVFPYGTERIDGVVAHDDGFVTVSFESGVEGALWHADDEVCVVVAQGCVDWKAAPAR